MRVELEIDETWALLSVVAGRLLEDAELSDEDRAALRRWRSEEMRRSGDSIRALTERLNQDLARVQKGRERSQIQKHDWI